VGPWDSYRRTKGDLEWDARDGLDKARAGESGLAAISAYTLRDGVSQETTWLAASTVIAMRRGRRCYRSVR
jgi:hypothetical protein